MTLGSSSIFLATIFGTHWGLQGEQPKLVGACSVKVELLKYATPVPLSRRIAGLTFASTILYLEHQSGELEVTFATL